MKRKCKCHSDLVMAQAYLAYIKALPTGSFTTYTYGGVLAHGIDRKHNEIKKAEAEVARLKVLTKEQIDG